MNGGSRVEEFDIKQVMIIFNLSRREMSSWLGISIIRLKRIEKNKSFLTDEQKSMIRALMTINNRR